MAALDDRRRTEKHRVIPIASIPHGHAADEEEAKQPKLEKGSTLYVPQMAPIHFPVLVSALGSLGYDVRLLSDVRPSALELGLRYVNNDACYPAIVVIGAVPRRPRLGRNQRRKARSRPRADLRSLPRDELSEPASLGPSRLRTSRDPRLLDFGGHDRPRARASDRRQGPSPHDARGALRRHAAAAHRNSVRAREATKGDAEELRRKWTDIVSLRVKNGSYFGYTDTLRRMTADFLRVPVRAERIPQAGIVGEILLKYHPDANQRIVDEMIEQGVEPVVGDLSSFFLYCLYDDVYRAEHYGDSKGKAWAAKLMIGWIESLRKRSATVLAGTPFPKPHSLASSLAHIRGVVSAGQQAGEGWLLTAEMMESLETAFPTSCACSPSGVSPTTSPARASCAPFANASPKRTSAPSTLKRARAARTSRTASSSSFVRPRNASNGNTEKLNLHKNKAFSATSVTFP